MKLGWLLIALLAVHGSADTVVIAAEDDWYPYCAKVGNTAQGKAVDIVREAFRAADVSLKLEVMPYARCMALAKAGQVVGCFNAARNSKLESDYVWHRPALFKARIGIYARADSKQTGLGVKDLEGKDVAVTNGYEYGDAFDTNLKVRRSVGNQDILGFRKLAAGRVQYALAYEKVASSIFERNRPEFDGKFKLVGMTAEPGLYIAFTKATPDGERYAQKLSAGLEAILANGKYREIESKWQ